MSANGTGFPQPPSTGCGESHACDSPRLNVARKKRSELGDAGAIDELGAFAESDHQTAAIEVGLESLEPVVVAGLIGFSPEHVSVHQPHELAVADVAVNARAAAAPISIVLIIAFPPNAFCWAMLSNRLLMDGLALQL